MTMQPPLDIIHTLPRLAPCEHIAGNEKFALKALEFQSHHVRADGTSLVDVTLDLEDGAPVGQEESLRATFVKILRSQHNALRQTGVRVHAPSSPHFERDLEQVISGAPESVAYITIPKVTSPREIVWADGVIRHYLRSQRVTHHIPLHLLIETPEALECLDALAAHPAVQTLDLGLMDFISHVGGAIPAAGMRSPLQFEHPLLKKVKSDIALTALRHNKVPNHNVTVDVRNPAQAFHDAFKARHEYGFLRMWSIHPEQIAQIIRAMLPSTDEVQEAVSVLSLAQRANWGPIEHNGRLHDRASYRYYWGILQQSGTALPPSSSPTS